MKSKMLILFLLLNIFTNVYNIAERHKRLEKKFIDTTDFQLIDKNRDPSRVYSNLEKDLYLKIFDFVDTKYINSRKEYYIHMLKKISELKKSLADGGNVIDLYLLPEEVIEDNENYMRIEKISTMIKKETKYELTIEYDEETEIFLNFNYSKEISHLWKNKAQKIKNIKNISEASQFVNLEPPSLTLKDKQICIPTVSLIKVKNINKENLYLRSIFTDMDQVSIFYLDPKDTQDVKLKRKHPSLIPPGESLVFQLVILPDTVGKIKGNLIFYFQKRRFVFYPIEIDATPNIYKVSPVYHPDLEVSKLLKVPIEIYNPHEKSLIIKEVTNTFSSINTEWINGHFVSPNKTTLSHSFLEIPPKETMTVLYLTFYKEFEGREYGLFQIKTDKDVLIIPLLISAKIPVMETYPKYFDFGLIDINIKINRVIPISIKNNFNYPLLLLEIFSAHNDYVEFIPNLSLANCFSKVIDGSLDDITKSNHCLIGIGEEIPLLGYLILKVDEMNLEISEETCVHSYIMIYNNSTVDSFFEIEFSYCIFEGFKEYSMNGKEIKLDRNYYISLDYDKKKEDLSNYVINSKIRNAQSLFSPPLSDPFYGIDKDEINNNSHNPQITEIVSTSQSRKESESIESFLTLKQSIINPNLAEYINLYLTVNNPSILKKYYHIPYKTSFMNKYGMIPIKFNTNSLEYVYCDISSNYKDCIKEKSFDKNYFIRDINLKETYYIADFGTASTSHYKLRYFAVINDSHKDMKIQDIEVTSSYLNLSLLNIQEIYDSNNMNSFSSGYKVQKITFNSFKRDKINLFIPKGTYLWCSLKLMPRSDGNIKQYVRFMFDDMIKLNIVVRAVTYSGQFIYFNPFVRFQQPGFPGLVQTEYVGAYSNFEIPVKIEDAKSQDDRIVLEFIEDNRIIKNNERKEFLKVIFDPKRQIKNRYFYYDPNKLMREFKISYKLLYLWRENEKMWRIMEGNNEENIEFNLNFKLNISDMQEFGKVSTVLMKPKMVIEYEIDFDIVKIGETASRYIDIINPSNEMITVQLFLADSDYSDIDNNDVFNKNDIDYKDGLDDFAKFDCFFVYTTTTQYNILNLRKRRSDNDCNTKMINDVSIPLYHKFPILFKINDTDSFLSKAANKSEILNSIYSNSPYSIRMYYNSTDKLFCDIQTLKRIDILNNFEDLHDFILSKEYKMEIKQISNMTINKISVKQKPITRKEDNLFDNIMKFVRSFFKTEEEEKPIQNNESEIAIDSQDFYIPNSLSSRIHKIEPKKRIRLGPIFFNPKNNKNSTATLFLKNNLTILYPVTLRGIGGSGNLIFGEISKENRVFYRLKDNVVTFEFNNLDINKDSSEKVVRLANSGNTMMTIEKINVGEFLCENSWIRLDYCGAITLEPREIFDLKIIISPDFNSQDYQNEIKFYTDENVFSILVKVEINPNILIFKNRLFSFEILNYTGFISCMLMISLFVMILKIFCVIFNEINTSKHYREKNKLGNMANLDCNELIKINPKLKFENLFIRSYRKSNQDFYDDFKIKEEESGDLANKKRLDKEVKAREFKEEEKKIENEKEFNYSNRILNDKEKISNVNCFTNKEKIEEIKSEKIESFKSDINRDVNDKVNKIDSVKNLDSLKSEKIKENKENKDFKESAQPKQIHGKKANKAAANKKPASYNLIGIGNKPIEKEKEIKEEPEVISRNKKNSLTKETIPNAGSNKNEYNINHIHPHNNLNQFKQEINYNYSNYDKKKNFQVNYEADNYRPKNNRKNSNKDNKINKEDKFIKEKDTKVQPKENIITPNPFNQLSLREKEEVVKKDIEVNITKPKEKLEEKSKETQILKLDNPEIPAKTISEENQFKAPEIDTKTPEIEELNNTIMADNTDKSFENIVPEATPHVNIGQKDNEPLLINPTLTQQFLAFDPMFFINKEAEQLREELIREPLNNKEINYKYINNKGNDLNIEEANFILKKESRDLNKIDNNINQNNNLINNYNAFGNLPNNFQILDTFDKKEEHFHIDSDVDDFQFQPKYLLDEEDAFSHNYLSEKEKYDSGAEEFRFNFNSIFTQNKMKLMDHTNYKEDTTDNEEIQSGNKPYFDKNFLFPDLKKSMTGLFASSNPFAQTSNMKLLDELREENNEDEDEEKNHEYHGRKYVDDELNCDEEEEEDPEWADEKIDAREVGYFDETGTFKLRKK
jgi:hypothetical protein